MSDVTVERETRTCAKCGVDDTHAHHIQYVAFLHPVTGEAQDLSITKHVQCCAEDGCEICATDVEVIGRTLSNTAPSDEFTAAIQEKSDDHVRTLFERHAIESPNYQIPATGEGSNG